MSFPNVVRAYSLASGAFLTGFDTLLDVFFCPYEGTFQDVEVTMLDMPEDLPVVIKQNGNRRESRTRTTWEIIREILAWLPVKSLCRFRCVQKSWNYLTYDPRFIKFHYDKATEHDNVLCQRRRVFVCNMWMLCSVNLDEGLKHINLDDHSGYRFLVDSTYLRDFMGLAIHCNGLLFGWSCYHEFMLFNPVINQTKILPMPPTYDSLTLELCGFGFDVSAMDYKVVHGHFCDDGLRFSLYSLISGSWRVIETMYPYIHRTPAVEGRIVNGGVHWMVGNVKDGSSSMVIISFGLADEDVSEILMPPDFNVYEDEEEYYLSVFEGCICVGKRDALAFWVMREYGVVNSWTKIRMNIPFYEGLHSGFVKKNHHLLLFQVGSQLQLVMYNFDKKRSRNLSVHGVREVCSAGIYLESLVSPNKYSITQ
ncbi:F-box/kelch-repeat protein At3g06240-like [Argentina anserina]|uniref:F-box/kelch-repeat protein At3g06240-like n=1 Tax=Argentina anserina TaxID=57926 RepID=UPI0021762322|nr:F-box/kelch-repeat protein At3g06240-like [Potentilla anserina]